MLALFFFSVSGKVVIDLFWGCIPKLQEGQPHASLLYKGKEKFSQADGDKEKLEEREIPLEMFSIIRSLAILRKKSLSKEKD